MREHAHRDRRIGGVQDLRLLAAEQLQRARRVVPDVGQHRRAHRAVHQDRADRAEVEHRARRPALLARLQAEDVAERRPVAHQRLVREHARARLGGRPGREQQHRERADLHAQAALVEVALGDRVGEGVEGRLVDRVRRRALAQHDERGPLLDERHGLGQQRQQVDVVVDAIAGDDHRQLGVGDHERQLARPVAGVDRDDHAAGQRDPVEGRDGLDAVGHQVADLLALLEAGADQAAGDLPRFRGQLRVADALVGEDERVEVRVPLRRAEQQVTDADRLGVALGRPGHGVQLS